jgi:hypothetical protein
MIVLIKNVSGGFYENITDNLLYIKSVRGEIQMEDYINTDSFIAFLQNLSRVETTSRLKNPLIYGLRNNNKLPIIELNIDF